MAKDEAENSKKLPRTRPRRVLKGGSRASARRSEFPYFKVQRIDSRVLAWMDARKEAFDTLEEARRFLAEQVAPRAARIIIVEREGRRILEDHPGAE